MDSLIHRAFRAVREGVQRSGSALRRAYVATGAPELAVRARLFVAVLSVIALGFAAGGLIVSPFEWPQFVVVLALIIASQLARLRIRIFNANFSAAWGDAAFIVAIWIGPDGWLPVTVGVGVFLANVLLIIFADEWRPFVDIVRRAVSASIAAGI